jgi:hypothetical protein
VDDDYLKTLKDVIEDDSHISINESNEKNGNTLSLISADSEDKQKLQWPRNFILKRGQDNHLQPQVRNEVGF